MSDDRPPLSDELLALVEDAAAPHPSVRTDLEREIADYSAAIDALGGASLAARRELQAWGRRLGDRIALYALGEESSPEARAAALFLVAAGQRNLQTVR